MLFISALTTLFLVAAPAWPQAKSTVRVTGEGVTQYEAQQDAIRKALQLSLDQFVAHETVIANDELLLDQISSSTNGFVERFEIVTLSGSDGHFVLVADLVLSSSRIKNLLGSSTAASVKVDTSGALAEAEAETNRRAARRKEQDGIAALKAGEVKKNTEAAMTLLQERFSEPSTRMFKTSTSFELNEIDPNFFEASIKMKWSNDFLRSFRENLKSIGAKNSVCTVHGTDGWHHDSTAQDINVFDCEIPEHSFLNGHRYLRSNMSADWFRVCFNNWDGMDDLPDSTSYSHCTFLAPVEWDALKPTPWSAPISAARNRSVVGRFGVEIKVNGRSIGTVVGRQAILATKQQKNIYVANGSYASDGSREFAIYFNCSRLTGFFGCEEDLMKFTIPIEDLEGSDHIETIPFIYYE